MRLGERSGRGVCGPGRGRPAAQVPSGRRTHRSGLSLRAGTPQAGRPPRAGAETGPTGQGRLRGRAPDELPRLGWREPYERPWLARQELDGLSRNGRKELEPLPSVWTERDGLSRLGGHQRLGQLFRRGRQGLDGLSAPAWTAGNGPIALPWATRYGQTVPAGTGQAALAWARTMGRPSQQGLGNLPCFGDAHWSGRPCLDGGNRVRLGLGFGGGNGARRDLGFGMGVAVWAHVRCERSCRMSTSSGGSPPAVRARRSMERGFSGEHVFNGACAWWGIRGGTDD